MRNELGAKLLISAVACVAIVAVLNGIRSRALEGSNDFMPLYVAAQLAGSGELYNPEPYLAFQRERFGAVNESLRFTRLPFYSALLAPLRLLDFEPAYWLFNAIRVVAIGAFIWLWPVVRSRADSLLFVSLSMPVYMAMMAGQDSVLLLPLIALSMRLEKERPFWAGVALSLCAIKYHLFVLFPLLLIAKGRWDVARGIGAAAAAMLALSFAAGGLAWPMAYFETLTDNRVHPGAIHMPNLHGLGLPVGAEAAACIAIAVSAWFAMRRAPFDVGFAIALIGGLVLSYHSYVMDCVLLVPALTIVLVRAEVEWLRIPAVFYLAPPAALLLLSGPPKSYIMQAGLAMFLAVLMFWVLKVRAPVAILQPNNPMADSP